MQQKNIRKVKNEKQEAAAIPENRLLSMIVLEALSLYRWSVAVGGQPFDVYSEGLVCHGAEQLQDTRHCAVYLAYDGLLSAIRIRFYVHTSPPDCHGTRAILDGPQVYPEYIPDAQMLTTPAVIVHELNDFASVATQV